jgi:hypothetical protein
MINSNIKFRKATKTEINQIMNIFSQAQEHLRLKGVNQWQNNYPNLEIIEKDIKNENGYVITKNSKVIAFITVIFSPEISYEIIYDGKWISNGEYAVVHRMAIDNDYKKTILASFSLLLKNIEQICLNKNIYSIKTDTHRNNLSMQKILKKNGFKYCGIIYLADGSERLAFEKIL